MVDRGDLPSARVVLVPHPVREDVSSAAQWGELRYAREGYVYPDQLVPSTELHCFGRTAAGADLMPGHVAGALDAAIRAFDPGRDYLLLVGDHIQVAALCAGLGARYGAFTVLRYDRQARGYVPVRIQPNWGPS